MWKCKKVDTPRLGTFAGAAYYYDPPKDYDWELDPDRWGLVRGLCKEEALSEYYWENNSHRPPIVVVMPGLKAFCVDSACYIPLGQGFFHYFDGWTVQGDIEDLSVEPAINMMGAFHGHVYAGTIGEDLEGRKYLEQVQ